VTQTRAPQKPRDEAGKFTKQDPDDWEREFDRTQYIKQL
jgi:hypothetical protein